MIGYIAGIEVTCDLTTLQSCKACVRCSDLYILNLDIGFGQRETKHLALLKGTINP